MLWQSVRRMAAGLAQSRAPVQPRSTSVGLLHYRPRDVADRGRLTSLWTLRDLRLGIGSARFGPLLAGVESRHLCVEDFKRRRACGIAATLALANALEERAPRDAGEDGGLHFSVVRIRAGD